MALDKSWMLDIHRSNLYRVLSQQSLPLFYLLEALYKNTQYELTIPYENDNELDDKINSLLVEMDSEANLKNCFIEADVTAMDGSDRSW